MVRLIVTYGFPIPADRLWTALFPIDPAMWWNTLRRDKEIQLGNGNLSVFLMIDKVIIGIRSAKETIDPGQLCMEVRLPESADVEYQELISAAVYFGLSGVSVAMYCLAIG